MGNEASHFDEFSKLSINTCDFEQIQRELKSTYRCSDATVKKHGWDRDDHTANISVPDDNQMAIRGSTLGTTDAVRGQIGYKGGLFLFEFEWIPGKDKSVCVGLATAEASLTTEGRGSVLGNDEKSIGWDLVNRCIYFKGSVLKQYPDPKILEGEVPSTFMMVLDMARGTLSFRTASTDFGVAIDGLKGISNHFCLAASLDKPGDSIRVTHLGGLKRVNRALRDSINSSAIRFHGVHGTHIALIKSNMKAQKNDSEKVQSTVFTHRTLKDGETFTICCESMENKGSKMWIMGGTSVRPEEMDFDKDVQSNEGQCWLYAENKILTPNEVPQEVNFDLDFIQTGNTVGIKRCDGELEFLINGDAVGRVKIEEDDAIYGVVSVHAPSALAIVDSDYKPTPLVTEEAHWNSTSIDATQDASELISELPTTTEELYARIESTIPLLKDKSLDKIQAIHHRLRVDIYIPMSNLNNVEKERAAADKVVEVEGGAQLMTDYMLFLWELGWNSDATVAECYKTLLGMTVNITDLSELARRKFGESGLLRWMIIEELPVTKEDNQNNPSLLKDYITILHNSARAVENKSIYKQCGFLEIGKQYIEIYPDDDLKTVCMYIIMSNICDKEELEYLSVSEKAAEHLVRLLQKAVASGNSESYAGWNCGELAEGIVNLTRYQPNIDKFMTNKPITYFVKMLSCSDENYKIFAMRGIMSLVTSDNRTDVMKAGGLLVKLRRLISHPNEDVKATALELIARLSDGVDEVTERVNENAELSAALDEETNDTEERKRVQQMCDYKAKCSRFKAVLKLPEEYFDASKDTCYCTECHDLRGDELYSTTGDPPKKFAVPVGWCKFGLSLPPRAKVLKVNETWHHAYHGTKYDNIEGILTVGEIVPAGQPVLGGMHITEASGHFNDFYKPAGFDTKKVFLSPTMRYAGNPAYAKPKLFIDEPYNRLYNVRTAFEVYIAPGSYQVSGSTLLSVGRVDPGFSDSELAWSTNQRGSCIIHGLLVKLDEDTDYYG